MTDRPASRPIETAYAGRRFRSRTEARWAVYFDNLDIAWEYEKEGYDLGTPLGRYLPDFWLPQVNMWAEVKGGPFSDVERRKCQALADLTGYDCLLLDGQPAAKPYEATQRDLGHPGWHLLTTEYLDEKRFFWSELWEEGSPWCEAAEDAVGTALSARFEFGESGS